MKRLAVFVFYDSEGIVDDYVLYVLRELDEVVDKLVFIINGEIISEDKKKIKTITNYIVERNNNGFDGGAYKEYFTRCTTQSELLTYDEVIILNDSFYGPIYPLTELFKEMSTVECDYWGLTRHNGYHERGYNIPPHIQGYFLVFRKKIICDSRFLLFWTEMHKPNNYDDAVKNYEVGICLFLNECGFKGVSYTDIKGGGQLITRCINPFIEEPYKLIVEYNCPILKRKAISLLNTESIKALTYIRDRTNYGIELILGNWNRNQNKKEGSNIEELNDFFLTHEKVYIYGNGKIGNALNESLTLLGYKVQGVVVSSSESGGEINIEELRDINNVGIIIGVGKKLLDEVFEKSKEVVGEGNIYIPY